jgi:hypothetical protein
LPFKEMKFPVLILALLLAAAAGVAQSADSDALVLRFLLLQPTYQICIPFGTSTTLPFVESIDWGDAAWKNGAGSSTQAEAPSAAGSGLPTVTCFGSRQTRGLTHTYSSSIPRGTFVDVKIRFRTTPPTFPQFGFVYNATGTVFAGTLCDGSWERAGAHVELRAVTQWNANFFRPVSMDCAFAGAGLLTQLPAFNGDASQSLPNSVRSLRGTFLDARAFNDVGVSQWRVNAVTTMDYMFFNARTFEHNLRRWCGRALVAEGAPVQFSGGFESGKITSEKAPDWSNRSC